MITLETVEELMKETGADFYLVSWALKASHGDVNQARDYIHRNRQAGAAESADSTDAAADADDSEAKAAESTSSEDSTSDEKTHKEPNVEDILRTIREVLSKVNATNIVIRKEGKVLLNLSVTIGAIGVILAPIAALIGLGAAVLTAYEIVIVLEDGRELNLMAMAKDEVNNIKRSWEYYTETRHENKSGKSYDASYETHDAGDSKDTNPDDETK